jgi:hypothetical protein
MALLDPNGIIEECNSAFIELFSGLAFQGESIRDFLGETALAQLFGGQDDTFTVRSKDQAVTFECERESLGFTLVARTS